jgi:hypothetical protein
MVLLRDTGIKLAMCENGAFQRVTPGWINRCFIVFLLCESKAKLFPFYGLGIASSFRSWQ